MIRVLSTVIILLVFEMLLHRCANPLSPTGGPKDTLAPVLITSLPEDQTLNFDGTTITLEFDEFILADKLKRSLIITPITDVKYKHTIKKRSVILNFDEPFEENTTYTFNFFDGITDITEKNPAENLVIAFSTGNYIDSLYLFGNIKELKQNNPKKDMVVGLYRITDSLDLFSDKPTYFITTDKGGEFRIQNIKENKYRLLAFQDENKNLLFDPKEEYAFLADTINLSQSIEDSITLKSIAINPAELKLISGRPTTKYFEIRYSKPIHKYSIINPDVDQTIASDLTGEKESIKLFNSFNMKSTDSLRTILQVSDSLGNISIDTLYAKFRESSRKNDAYKLSMLPPDRSNIFDNTNFQLTFNKPTYILDSNFLYIPIDTLIKIPVETSYEKWNFNNTVLNFKPSNISDELLSESIKTYQMELIGDSTQIDSMDQVLYNKLDKYLTDRYSLRVKAGAFISVESDTSEQIQSSYVFGKQDNFGIITVNISTDKPSYQLQVMKGEEVVTAQTNCVKCIFNRLSPGEYWFRVLIDDNENGQYDIGNVRKNIQPETIIYFKEKTTSRANWENQLEFSF